jgi:hypothetical protein
MKKWTELNESEKVKQLVDIGVPMAEAIKAAGSKKAEKVELTESHKAEESLDKLVEAYQLIGLNESEAKLAAQVEQRIKSQDIDWSKFEF